MAYDDGEAETRVEARLITPLDGGGSDSDRRSDRFSEGDKIEADYRGRGKFYPGKISRDRGDDTYDIDYDDGERETRVSKRQIRKKDRSRSRSRSPRGGGRLREGDKVEADYRGRGRFYPGKIDRDRRDGTYDIAYDDGERETRVEERLIRKKGGSRSPSPKRGRKLREGAKVQARYRMCASVEIPFDSLFILIIQAAVVSTIRGASNATAGTGPTTCFTTTARRRRASSRSTSKPRKARVMTNGNATMAATGAAGECASEIRLRRATEVCDQCRNLRRVSRTNRKFRDVSVLRRAIQVLQGQDLPCAGRRNVLSLSMKSN